VSLELAEDHVAPRADVVIRDALELDQRRVADGVFNSLVRHDVFQLSVGMSRRVSGRLIPGKRLPGGLWALPDGAGFVRAHRCEPILQVLQGRDPEHLASLLFLEEGERWLHQVATAYQAHHTTRLRIGHHG